LVGQGVGDEDFTVGVTGEGPGQVVNQVMVVPTQADQVCHLCLATVAGEDDVVGFINAGRAAGEPAVPVPDLNGFTQMWWHGAVGGQASDHLPLGIHYIRIDDAVTQHAVNRVGGGDGG